MTDRGVMHEYGWSYYDHYEVDQNSGEITLYTNPGDGAGIRFTPDHRARWTSLFDANGLQRTD